MTRSSFLNVILHAAKKIVYSAGSQGRRNWGGLPFTRRGKGGEGSLLIKGKYLLLIETRIHSLLL
jgi:hypothetical protein